MGTLVGKVENARKGKGKSLTKDYQDKNKKKKMVVVDHSDTLFVIYFSGNMQTRGVNVNHHLAVR